MSLKHDISVYDAAYVALASYLDTTLYTADLELIQKAPQYSKHVKNFRT